MSPEPRTTTTYDDSVYREVEERGRTRIVLMRKGMAVTHRPAYDRPVKVSETVSDDATEIVYGREHVPAETTGRSWWEKVR